MKRISFFLVVLSVLSLIFSQQLSAQGSTKGRGMGGWGKGSAYNRLYNPRTVETLEGEIISVDKITPVKGMSYGVHLMLRTDKDTISVHVGPGWYVNRQDLTLKVTDSVEVQGSRITFEGKPAIIAAEIKKDDQTLNLRNENGFPMWSGSRQR
jgi:hypothetical protein